MQIANGETGTSAPQKLPNSESAVNVQVTFVSAGECVLEGSLDGGNTWEQIDGASFSSGTVTTLSPVPKHIRANVSSGEVNVWIQ